MERWENKVAVVTGASSGIGAAIAKDLALAGVQVVGLARRKEQIEAIREQLPANKRSQLTALYCDVSDVDCVNKVFDDILVKFGGIDILINNAACWKGGQLATMNAADIQQTLLTNVMGVVHCTQRAVKSMKERNFDGHVILVNSIAGHSFFTGNPNQMPISNMYTPSKHAITAMNELYRLEFLGLGTKIKISSISPGVVDTEILLEELRRNVGDCMLQCEDISNAVLYILGTPAHVQIHELIIKPMGEKV